MSSKSAATNGARILVIDDDERMRDSLRESLERRGYRVRICADGESGIAACQEASFDAIVCDLRMPGLTGIEVCARLRELGCPSPIVVITAFGSVETAVDAMREGAFDYITKPFKGDELQIVVEKAVGHGRVMRENQSLRAENHILKTQADRSHALLVGESTVMDDLRALIERYADSDATVLVRGESGVGKEVVARMLHSRGHRRERPFVCVNCAALSAGLLESELFGHEKGAFTGADSRRQGRFELAEGGTILLDEVSEIDLNLQAKLLRVLQEKTFERVGSSRPIRASVRVIATSNRDLESEVRRGTFRRDLFFRLNVLPIEIPPLRMRKEDVPLLTRYFLEKIHRRVGGAPKRLGAAAGSMLTGYDWPGNVRELENVIERAWVLTDGEVIRAEAFPGFDAAPVPEASSSQGDALEAIRGLPLKRVERLLIQDALSRYGGHQKRTATELGIGVRTLRTKIKKWNLKSDPDRESELEEVEEEALEVAAR